MGLRYTVVYDMSKNQIESLLKTHKHLNVIFNFQYTDSKIIINNFEPTEFLCLLEPILKNGIFEIQVNTPREILYTASFVKIEYQLNIPHYSSINNSLKKEHGYIGNYIINYYVHLDESNSQGNEYFLKYESKPHSKQIFSYLINKDVTKYNHGVVLNTDSFLGLYKPSSLPHCKACKYYNRSLNLHASDIRCAVNPLMDFNKLFDCKDYEPS